jgi:hypothetical protein
VSYSKLTVKVLSGGTVSNALNLRDYEVEGIMLPAALTSVAITLESRAADTDDSGAAIARRAVKDSAGAAVSLTVAANTYVSFTAAHAQAFKGLADTRLIMGSAEGADREFYLVVKPIN